MNKKYFFLLGLLLLLCGIQGVQAQTQVSGTWYVLYDTTEYSINGLSSGVIHTYTLDAPCEKLSFEGKRGGGATTPNFTVQQYVNEVWSDVVSKYLTNSYQTFSDISIDRNATQLRFNANYNTFKRYIKNVKVTMATYLEKNSEPSAMSTTVGTPVTTSFTMGYSNVSALTVSSSNASLFTPDISGITAGGGIYGTQTIMVTYNPTAAGTHSGTITITNGTQTLTVNVSGTAVKKTQTITWNANATIAVGDTVSNIATASSGLALTYTSDDESVIKVEDGKLISLASGTANIIATQAGNDTWAVARDTVEFTATQKTVQTITWEQDFFRLKTGDANITLTATASSSLPVTYTSSNADVVAVSGSTLIVVGVGTATLTAVQAGNSTYAAASLEKVVRVRVVSTGCDEYALYDMTERSLYTIATGTELALTRPAGDLYFYAKRDGAAFSYFYVQQKVNGSWSDIANPDLTSSYAQYGPYTLNRNATAVRFLTKTGQLCLNIIKISMLPRPLTSKPTKAASA